MISLCCPKAVADAYQGTANKFQPANGTISFDEAKKSLNKYATTIHAISSAIVKLSKLTPINKVFFGKANGSMPECFVQANEQGVRGGVELGFQSTTYDRDMAKQYARSDKGGPSIVFEVQMGMVDRGADISALSQYPGEKECLFAPLTGFELLSERVEGCIQVVELRVSVNLNALTMDEVINKMQRTHVDLLQLFKNTIEYAKVHPAILAPLDKARLDAERREGAWFNNSDNFRAATAEAFKARDDVFGDLLKKTQEGKDLLKKPDEGTMEDMAIMCAREGQHDVAIAILRSHLSNGRSESNGWKERLAAWMVEEKKLAPPWPATFVRLAADEEADKVASLARGINSSSVELVAGTRVLAYVSAAGSQSWHPATVRRGLQSLRSLSRGERIFPDMRTAAQYGQLEGKTWGKPSDSPEVQALKAFEEKVMTVDVVLGEGDGT